MFLWRIVSVLALTVLAACVSQPVELTCHRLKMPTAVGQEVILSDFAVRAPSGSNWCQGPQGKGVAMFFTSPYMGQTLSAPPPRNSIFLAAQVVQVDQHEIQNYDQLRVFVEAFMSGGYVSQLSENGVIASRIDPSKKDPRFTYLGVKLFPDPARPEICVRYESRNREQNNPGAPGIVFEETDFGMFCRLPGQTTRLANLGFSERHEVANPTDPAFTATLRARDAEPFLSSFRPLN